MGSNKKNNLKNVAMLSGIAFEMGAIIFWQPKGEYGSMNTTKPTKEFLLQLHAHWCGNFYLGSFATA